MIMAFCRTSLLPDLKI